MKIEIEIDDKAVQAKVIEALVKNMSYEAKVITENMVKDIILGEVRATIKAHTAELLKDMVLADGRTVKQYVLDRINMVRTGNFSYRERLGVENIIDNVVQSYASTWYRELVEPHMGKIKGRIKEEIIDRLLRESA